MRKQSRRKFLSTAAAALPAAAFPLTAQTPRRPNVILFITDDQGYGDLSLHGNDHLKTPNLDSIGKEGAQFTQFHVSPVCSPTRSSLMTGRYNYRTGVVDTYLGRSMMHADEVTLAEILGGAGYRTGIFGKWHLGDNYPMRSIDQGFQESLVHNGGGIGQPSDPPGNSYFDPVLQHNGREVRRRGYCTDIFVNAAVEFIEKNRNRPFFAYVSTNAPHDPLEIDESYVAPFRAMGLDDATAKVYGMVRNIDENMSRLLAGLKRLRLEQDTILIFLTDNGPQRARYNGGMRGTKGMVYQGGIRVPCFVRWPRMIDAGLEIDRASAHIDILPTLLDACGVDKPAEVSLDGRSLMPLLRGANNWPDRTLCFQWHRGDEPELYRRCAARNQRFKLVNGKELYDLAEDPGESRDIAGERTEIVKKMRSEYEAWFRDVSSTRGYAPPRIHLGTDYENPVTLTRQDWRGPDAGWKPDSLGHWEVKVTRSARYEVTLRTYPAEGAGEARLKFRGLALTQPIAQGATECRFNSAALEEGEGTLEAFLAFGEKKVGVRYVDVKRL
jgi:arylsulfatase A-like enzyme